MPCPDTVSPGCQRFPFPKKPRKGALSSASPYIKSRHKTPKALNLFCFQTRKRTLTKTAAPWIYRLCGHRLPPAAPNGPRSRALGSRGIYLGWQSRQRQRAPGHRSRTARAQPLPQPQPDLPTPAVRRAFGVHGAACTQGPPSDGTGRQRLLLAQGPPPIPAAALETAAKGSRTSSGLERGRRGVKARSPAENNRR